MVRQGLDNFARVKICSIQGRQSQIGTRNLCQCGYMFFQECQVKIGTRSFRQEEDSLPLGPVNSNIDQISYLGMRSLFYQAGRDRQGLDLFARFEISSLQGHQGQMGINLFDVFQEFQVEIGTRFLHQGEDFLSLWPVDSDRDKIYLSGRRSLHHKASRVREGQIGTISFHQGEDILHLGRIESEID